MEFYKRHTIIENDHTEQEYVDFLRKLSSLNDKEIKLLATRLGIKFEVPSSAATRDDYEKVLDEVYWDDFYREYRYIINQCR